MQVSRDFANLPDLFPVEWELQRALLLPPLQHQGPNVVEVTIDVEHLIMHLHRHLQQLVLLHSTSLVIVVKVVATWAPMPHSKFTQKHKKKQYLVLFFTDCRKKQFSNLPTIGKLVFFLTNSRYIS